jgi:archaellum biogenesis ATPase FlaH
MLKVTEVVPSPKIEQLQLSTKATKEMLGMVVKQEKMLDSPVIWLDTLESMIQTLLEVDEDVEVLLAMERTWLAMTSPAC